MEEQTWEFLLVIQGTGETKQEAWKDAVESLNLDPDSLPDDEIT
jgi:hypothetical protein